VGAPGQVRDEPVDRSVAHRGATDTIDQLFHLDQSYDVERATGPHAGRARDVTRPLRRTR
jgi:hypothetical protein